MSYADEFNRFSGGKSDQFSTLLKMSPSNATGRKQQTMARPSYSVNMPKFKMPNINVGAVLNIAMIAGIGLVGYKLYNKFFGGASSIIDDLKDKGEKAVASTYVDNGQAKSNAISQTAASLQTKGLGVSAMHQSLANTYHDYFNRAFPDHDKIVKTIKGQNAQTFRLCSVAYGSRTIKGYTDWTITHLLQADTPFTMKETLQMILSDSEIQSIHFYISVI